MASGEREGSVMTLEANNYITIDRAKTLSGEPHKGHNRWHPDIPPIARVDPGAVVGIETRDAFDLQINESTTLAQVGRCNLNVIHPLTGPIYVEGAEPGDLLEVKILEIAAQPFGFTVQVPGFGFLRDLYREPHIIRWRIADGYATSADLPGVRIPGAPFMGVIGVAPSHDLLERIKKRERDLAARGGMVLQPEPADAVPSQAEIASQAIRTIAPHETGGNLDVKQLTAGTTLRLPVYTRGALFSVGDAHFAQGDNESCGTAVEMGATFFASFNVLKGQAARQNIRDPQFYCEDYFIKPEMAVPRRFFATTGQSCTRDGVAHAEDLTLAARNALLNMIDHLVGERGYAPQQAYAICSVAVDLRIAELVDVPNFVVSALLPLDIFV
jgi:formamidase